MNRFARYTIYAIMSLTMMTLILSGQRLVMSNSVHHSITQMGERLGRVLPQGYSDEGRLSPDDPDNIVSLAQKVPIATYHEYIVNEAPKNNENAINRPRNADMDEVMVEVIVSEITSDHSIAATAWVFSGIDFRVAMLVVVMYLASLFFVSIALRFRHAHADVRQVKPSVFVGILSLGSGVCVILATLLWVARVFWTGVDQAVYARSVVQNLDTSGTIRVRADQLLAMGSQELVMILIAMMLTALPILVWMNLKLLERARGPATDGPTTEPPAGGASTLMSRIYEHKLIDRHLSQQSIRRMSKLCYVIVVLFLWMAPWSKTMLNAIWMY